MSVQAGIWNFDGKPVDPKLLAAFSESLKPLGPDGEFLHLDGCNALLYRPFHTTVESREEKQPYFSPSGSCLTWDGRLDNRDELVAELRDRLQGDMTDVAIVAAAFDCWETDCFHRIIGDWAVSIWKPKYRELVLAADYLAIRHIFYYLKGARMWWSTDPTPLVLLSGDKFQIDDDYIAGYLANYPEARLTPYRAIRQVPPGHFVLINDARARVQRYWEFSPKSRIRYKTDAEYEEHFRFVFRASVRRRLRSDSPILAELSGGLDSSSIVCMADDILANEGAQASCVDTLSLYDKTEPNGDDWLYFPKIEEKRGRNGTHIDLSKLSSVAASLEYPEFIPLPGYFGAGRQIETERAAVVRDGGYRAVLSGVGGDELLGGVPDPRAPLADLIVQLKFIRLFKHLMAWSLVKRRPWIQLLSEALMDLLPRSLGQYIIKEGKVESWIRRDFAKRTQIAMRQLDVDEHFGLWLPTRRSSLGDVLLMANKLAKCPEPVLALEETRYPYLDQDLIEFVLAIPASQLLRPGERRSLMRRSLASLVPSEVLSRRTKGTFVRTPLLAMNNYWPELKSAFDTPLLSHFGYINQPRFLKELVAVKNGEQVHFVRILKAISLEFWLRRLAHDGLIDAVIISPPASPEVAPDGTLASNMART